MEGTLDFSLPEDLDRAQLLYEVVEVSLAYTTSDETGSVRDGWVQLRRGLKRVKLQPDYSVQQQLGEFWTMFVNGVAVTRESAYFQTLQPHVTPDPPYAEGDWRSSSELLYCMSARKYPGRGGTIVLLLRVVDHQKGVYRRVGLARRWDERMQGIFHY